MADKKPEGVYAAEYRKLVAAEGCHCHEVRQMRVSDFAAVSRANDLDTGDESPTQQQFKDEVDTANIVRRFGLGTSQTIVPRGVFGDFTGITSFAEAVEKIRHAEEGFQALAPEVREKFRNDPVYFSESVPYLTESELKELGVIPDDEAVARAAASNAAAAEQAAVDRLAKAVVQAGKESPPV